MKPIELTLEAFGPYATKQVIDFTELAAEHIFLITGKTGAGKSTLFDAMSFALFGEANGEMRDAQSLRSDYADADTPTEVSLTFDINQTRYQITRRPQQYLNKKRGSGQRLISGEAVLYRLDQDTQTLLGANIRDVQEQMQLIIPLSVTQFRQIMMIPQNEFRELLVSNSKDKEEILQKLADTSFYKLIQEQLYDRQRKAEEAVKLIEQQLQGLREEYYKLPQADTEKQQHRDICAHVEQLHTQTTAERERVLAEKDISEQRYTEAQKAKAVAETLLRQWQQLETVKQQQTQLLLQADEMKQLEQAVERAMAAEPIVTWIEESTSAVAIAKRKTIALEAAQVALVALKKTLVDITTQGQQLEEQRPQIVARMNETERLKQHLPAWQQLLSLQQQMNETVQAQELHTATFNRQTERLATDAALLATAQSQFEAAQVSDNQRFRIEQRIIDAQRWLKNYAKSEALIDEMTRTEEAIGYLEQQLIEAQTAQQRWNEERAKVIATEKSQLIRQLTAQLEENQPCPVCGSLDHPLQVNDSEQINVAETLADLDTLITGIVAQIAETKVQITTNTYKNTQAKVQLGEIYLELKVDDTTILAQKEQQEAMLEVAQAELEKFTVTTTLNEAEAKYARLRESFKRQEESHRALEVTMAANVARITAIANDRQRLEQSNPPLPSDIVAVQTQVEESTQILAAFEAAEQDWLTQKQAALIEQTTLTAQHTAAETAVETEQQRVKHLRELIDAKIAEAKFEDEVAVMQAALPADVLAQQQAARDAYRLQVQQLEQQRATLTQLLEGHTVPNIAEHEAAVKARAEERQQLQQQLVEIEQLYVNEQQLINNYETRRIAIQRAESTYNDISYLANVARGKNGSKLTFERYVLTSFLDLILEYANPRLRTMTDGRYQLQRQSELTKGNAQSGLELYVIDAYTSKTRHVKTLSGGESFKASLALALALADCIQELSGGLSLETIFIDEGFGTLDPDSLEQAIDMLLDTQANGRLVGIISHVPELKARIHSKLVINQTANGSTTHFSFN